jgi:Kelch motif
MRAAAVYLLLCAGCSHQTDPCAGVIGMCIALEVGGGPSPLDELDVSATQIPGRTVLGRASLSNYAFDLPVQFATILPDGLTGPLLVEVVGARNGEPLGYGSAALTVPPSGQRLKITMAPIGVGPTPDLSKFQVGADLAQKPVDLATGPRDLSVPNGADLAQVPACTGNCGVGNFATQSQHLNPPRTAYGMVVVGRNVYLIGGQAGAITPGPSTSVQRAPINPDGTLGQFVETATPLITARQVTAAVASSQYVYVVSGNTGDNGITPTFTGTVERAFINTDGSLGSFSTLSSQVATQREGHALAIVGSNLVVLGGDDGTNLLSSVEIAPILVDGTLGSFTAGPSLLTARVPTLVISSSFLYAVGGEAGGDVTVERASIAGGTLGSFGFDSITLRTRRTGHTATQVGDNIYVTGGATINVDAGGAIFPTSFERATLDFTGTLSDFSTVFGANLQAGRAGHGSVFTGNAFYVIGGYAGGAAPLDTIERAPVQ